MTQDAPVTALWNSWYGAAFLQDDYRINARVTLNLGLRWDVQTPGTDPLNRFSHLRARPEVHRQPGGADRAAVLRRSRASSAASSRRRGTIFSPRVGVVWDPFGDGKTADPRRRRHLLRQHLRQRVEHDDQLPAVVHPADLHQHQRDDERGRRAARRVAQQSLQQLSSAARRSRTTARTPNGGSIFGVSIRTSSGRTPTRPTSACSARSASRSASARPTSGRSTATCRSGAT